MVLSPQHRRWLECTAEEGGGHEMSAVQFLELGRRWPLPGGNFRNVPLIGEDSRIGVFSGRQRLVGNLKNLRVRKYS